MVNALAAAGHSSGARTFSPRQGRRAWRGPCARPLAGGLGSPRSQGKSPPAGCRWHTGAAHGQCACRGGAFFWSADFQSAAGAESMARPMRTPFGRRAWKPALPGEIPTGRDAGGTLALRAVNALAAAGHSSGARTFSPQRLRGTWRGAFTCPLACGLGSPRSRENPHRQDAGGTLRNLPRVYTRRGWSGYDQGRWNPPAP